MLKKTLAFAALLSATSYLGAKTAPIGSVVAHGDLRLDGFAVKGSGTAFDGTLVETGSGSQSDADLLLSNGTRINLHSDSRVTLYRDHLVLDRGEAVMTAPAPFQVEVKGLLVRTTGPTAGERIALDGGGGVGVVAQTGQLEVIGSRGEVLSLVGPQKSEFFARDRDGRWSATDAPFPVFNDDHGADHGNGNGNGHHHHHHPSH